MELEYTDISPYSDKSILKKITQSGVGNEYPGNESICLIFYTICLEDGAVVETNNVGNSVPFVVEAEKNMIIRGIEILISTMLKDEEAEIIVSYKYGYGRFGLVHKNIPPSSNLKCIVKLQDFYGVNSIINAKRIKEQGVIKFNNKQYEEALLRFKSAIGLGCFTSSESHELYLSLLMNSANCLFKLRKYEDSIIALDLYEAKSNTNPKLYYLRCSAKIKIFEKTPNQTYLDQAFADYNKLVSLTNPLDSSVAELKKQINACDIQLNKDQNTKKIGMFSGLYEDKPLSEKSESVPAIVSLTNPKVFLEIKQKSKSDTIMLEFELFSEVCPKTTENFRVLCTGEKEGQDGFENFTFVNSIFHRFIKGFMMQGGDFEKRNGTGGYSIYGQTFEDESFKFNHSEPYLLSMVNSGQKNTNGSQFMITFKDTPWLNGRQVVFGRLIKGQDCLNKLQESVLTDENDIPLDPIEIVSSGEIFKSFI